LESQTKYLTSGKETIAFVEEEASKGMMLYAIRSSVNAESESITRFSCNKNIWIDSWSSEIIPLWLHGKWKVITSSKFQLTYTIILNWNHFT